MYPAPILFIALTGNTSFASYIQKGFPQDYTEMEYQKLLVTEEHTLTSARNRILVQTTANVTFIPKSQC